MTARDDYLAQLGTWHLDADDDDCGPTFCTMGNGRCGRVATWEHDDGRNACADCRSADGRLRGWRRL